MENDIELICDDQGLAVIGETQAVERFLSSEGLSSKSLDLPQLRSMLSGGATAAQAGSEIAANSGRWVKLTKESAEMIEKYGLRENAKSGLGKWNVVPPSIGIDGRGAAWVSTKTGAWKGGSSPHHPLQSTWSGNAWKPNIPAPMISAPTPSKYAAP